jgi:hypothetical protein
MSNCKRGYEYGHSDTLLMIHSLTLTDATQANCARRKALLAGLKPYSNESTPHAWEGAGGFVEQLWNGPDFDVNSQLVACSNRPPRSLTVISMTKPRFDNI